MGLQRRFCMCTYTPRPGVRARLKHKEFRALEDHQLEAAAESFDNSLGYWALCCLNLSLARAIACHPPKANPLFFWFHLYFLFLLSPYKCKAPLILISDVLFMMLQMCYLPLTVFATCFSLKDTAWPCNSFHASSFRGWAFLFEWITSNHFSVSIISREPTKQRATALLYFFPPPNAAFFPGRDILWQFRQWQLCKSHPGKSYWWPHFRKAWDDQAAPWYFDHLRTLKLKVTGSILPGNLTKGINCDKRHLEHLLNHLISHQQQQILIFLY